MRQDTADVRPIIPPPPQVTLVVPNYNHARYLPESLGSIAAQTRAPNRVLIVDDASTDDSVSIISRFIAERRGWELIQHKENRGVVRRQNETLAAVTTEWIGFLGADDVLQPTYLEKALAEAARHPEVGLICACCEIIGLSERRMLRPMMLPARSSTVLAPADVSKILLAGDNYFPGMVSLFRRRAILSLGGFDESLGSFADSLLARQLALSFGFFFLAEVLGYWRIHGQNFSITSTSDPAVLSKKVAQIRNLVKHSDLFPSGFDELFERRTRFGAVRTVLSTKTPVGVKAAQAAALLKGGDHERRFLKLMLGLGYPGRIAALAWATLRTRPMSLFRLVGQLDARRAILAGSTAYRAP